MTEITILLIGGTDRAEFRDAWAALSGLGRVVWSADLDSGRAVLASGEVAPDLIVMAQAYPGQFSHEGIDRLRRLAPLARMLALLGTWCEGETRTGDPWPATARVYWHQWLPRARREVQSLLSGACSTWALPITAGEEERFLVLADEPLRKREGLIGICTHQYDMQDWLCRACTQRGYSTVWVRPHRPLRVGGATAIVFDGNECRDDEARRLKHLAAVSGPVPIIVLLDFPRPDDRDRVLACGAAAVLAKPLVVEDLFWQVELLSGDAAWVYGGN